MTSTSPTTRLSGLSIRDAWTSEQTKHQAHPDTVASRNTSDKPKDTIIDSNDDEPTATKTTRKSPGKRKQALRDAPPTPPRTPSPPLSQRVYAVGRSPPRLKGYTVPAGALGPHSTPIPDSRKSVLAVGVSPPRNKRRKAPSSRAAADDDALHHFSPEFDTSKLRENVDFVSTARHNTGRALLMELWDESHVKFRALRGTKRRWNCKLGARKAKTWGKVYQDTRDLEYDGKWDGVPEGEEWDLWAEKRWEEAEF